MQYHSYSDTFENVHDGGVARTDPLEPGRYLIPAKAAITTPGPDKVDHTQIWRPKAAIGWPYDNLPIEFAASGDDGDWLYIEDHRRAMDRDGTISGGTPYWLPAEGDKNGSRARYMTELGPLPGGAVTSEPAATTIELLERLRAQRDYKIANMLWVRERHADELMLGKTTTLTEQQYLEVLAYIQALRDLPAQEGAPFDGGGDETPWPTKPEI